MFRRYSRRRDLQRRVFRVEIVAGLESVAILICKGFGDLVIIEDGRAVMFCNRLGGNAVSEKRQVEFLFQSNAQLNEFSR